jgi:hypothetical protein
MCNNHCHGKAINITYSECASAALVSQHAMQMRSIILSSVACLAVPQFFTLSNEQHDWQKKKKNIKHKMRFDFLY